MSSGRNLIEVNGERLWDTLLASGKIGPGKSGGLRRLALTDSDKEMRDLFVKWCREAGCTVTIDGVGNIFARRPGLDDTLPPVVIGSHLDSQAAGGRYDGILGVLAGLEIVRTLNENRVKTRRPIEVVSWTNEEGARFSPPMIASGAFAGSHPLDWVLSRTDDDGKTFADELKRIGYMGDAPVGGRPFDAYFELHIEQGPELEAANIPVGVVTRAYRVHGMLVDVAGECAHGGPTPMDQRKNALIGAAALAVSVNDIGWRYHATKGKASVARLVAWPNKPGILAESAQVTLDVRHADPASADRMLDEVRAAIGEAEKRANVSMTVAAEWAYGKERFDPECVALVKASAGDLGVPIREMDSQAGHDAYHMSRVAPTCLIFTPCKGGVSHNEGEHIELSYTIPGVNVLLRAVQARADR